MKREYRIYKGAQLRAKKDAKGIEGHAAVFNQLSQDLGGFRERIMPGAFSADLANGPDIRCLFNHDANIIFGRTRSKTLRVAEDPIGLFFECDMPDTEDARSVQVSIDRGDIGECSFGFYSVKTKWSEEPDPDDPTGKSMMLVRELHEVRTFDVSPVTYPAYTGTDVDTRTLYPDGVPGEIRAHVPSLDRRNQAKRKRGEKLSDEEKELRAAMQCRCDCASCIEGDCTDCTLGVDCEEENCMHSGESADPGVRSAKRAEVRDAEPAGELVTGGEFEVLLYQAKARQMQGQ